MNELLLEKYAYKKKKPVLLPFLEDIKILLEHDATQKSILEYLKNEKNITVSQPYLSKFIRQYIYGNKKIDLEKTRKKKLNEETPKQKQSDKIDSNSNLDNVSKESDTVSVNEKEMSKAERDSLIDEWVKNNQNILAGSKR
jgi:hypothetical protein